MKYLVIGAGATGGCIAGHMHRAGKNVTIIARGKHLEAMQRDGLTIHCPNETLNLKVNALTEAEYNEKADIIIVCVKYYSIGEIYQLIKKASHDKTVVIPILNVYGTGERMAENLDGIEVINGCIYIASEIEDYGVLKQHSKKFRIVYGKLDGSIDDERLVKTTEDLIEIGISVVFSTDIKSDTMRKFSFVSCMAAVGSYFDVSAKDFKNPGKVRDAFISCIEEVIDISKAMGLTLPVDIMDINLKMMSNLDDSVTASMQKDVKKGGNSEIDGLVFEVVRLGEKHGVATPTYKMIADKFR